jgi:hypothetical protein
LTIQESYVTANSSQRRGGLHIESPGCFSDSIFTPANEHPWGCGALFGCDVYDGGIYIASNRSDTTKVWDALVDSSVPGIVDKGGGCEYLRPWLNEGTALEANELIWMTDRTPHEALAQKEDGHRQFFRLVIGGRDGNNVRHWYKDHSTLNPLVPLPDHVTVITGNKFEKYGMKVKSNEDVNLKPCDDGDRKLPAEVLKEEPYLWSNDYVLSSRYREKEERWRAEEAAEEAAKEAKERKSYKEWLYKSYDEYLERMEIVPVNLFREVKKYEGQFSRFDSTGLPTHDSNGIEIGGNLRKKLQHKLNVHTKHYNRYQAKNQKEQLEEEDEEGDY